MRYLLLLCLQAALSVIALLAQQAAPPRINAGFYAMPGLQWVQNGSVGHHEVLAGATGGFLEMTVPRHTWRAGLDLRGEGNDSGVEGTLTGVRLSAGDRIRPYGELLFGPGRHTMSDGLQTTTQNALWMQGVVGLDAAVSSHIAWRVVELKPGVLLGSNGTTTFGLGMGLVLRIR